MFERRISERVPETVIEQVFRRIYGAREWRSCEKCEAQCETRSECIVVLKLACVVER